MIGNETSLAIRTLQAMLRGEYVREVEANEDPEHR